MAAADAIGTAGVALLRLDTPFLVGPVNVWLIEDEPLTLVDTGPNTGSGLLQLRALLAERGHGLGDVGRVVVTHQHLDHAGLAGPIAALSGAEVVAFAGRTLHVHHRPGHSPSDLVLHDRERGVLLVGDHLLDGHPPIAVLHADLPAGPSAAPAAAGRAAGRRPRHPARADRAPRGRRPVAPVLRPLHDRRHARSARRRPRRHHRPGRRAAPLRRVLTDVRIPDRRALSAVAGATAPGPSGPPATPATAPGPSGPPATPATAPASLPASHPPRSTHA